MTAKGVTWLSVATNAALGSLKIAIGVFSGAQVLVADGLHSASDLVTDAAVLVGLDISSRPADREHNYGHRRVTTLVALFVGAVLLGAAGWIIYRAILTLNAPHDIARVDVAFWVAVVSILPKEYLYRVTRRAGIAASDSSVVANAWHHRTDAFTSIAAAAGLAGMVFSGSRWGFLDHLTAVVLAAFLGVMAVRFIRESAAELIDEAPGGPVVSSVERAIESTPGVSGFHELRARRLGGALMLDVHILVDPNLTVVQGHDIATAVRQRVIDCGCEVLEVVVHVEPEGIDESAP